MTRKREKCEEKGKGIAPEPQKKKKARAGDPQLDPTMRVSEAEEVLEMRTRGLSIPSEGEGAAREDEAARQGSLLDALLGIVLRRGPLSLRTGRSLCGELHPIHTNGRREPRKQN